VHLFALILNVVLDALNAKVVQFALINNSKADVQIAMEMDYVFTRNAKIIVLNALKANVFVNTKNAKADALNAMEVKSVAMVIVNTVV